MKKPSTPKHQNYGARYTIVVEKKRVVVTPLAPHGAGFTRLGVLKGIKDPDLFCLNSWFDRNAKPTKVKL